MANPNTTYAAILVDELVRAGLKHVCLAPGSRNTPLVLAFAAARGLKIYSHLDERSAAFFALGIGLGTGEAAAVVCTSGTATANFYPAIIEAHQSRVPMLILTADRPHELRHSGANQTIDQTKMFGDFVLWSVDAGLPESDPPDTAIRNLRTLAARALATANGSRRGVVHLNLPFRKPLEPEDRSTLELPATGRDSGIPFTQIFTGQLGAGSKAYPHQLRAIIHDHQAGLIICGPNAWNYSLDTDSAVQPLESTPVEQLAQYSGYPVLADPVSGIRFGTDNTIGAYDIFLELIPDTLPSPDVVIRLGNVPTSKWLNNYLDAVNPAYHIHLSADGVWADDSHRLTHVFQLDLAHLREGFPDQSPGRMGTFREAWCHSEASTLEALDEALDNGDYFDGAVLHDVIDLLPEESTLFAGNSLPIRHLDRFGKAGKKPLYAYANRGASGIDGNISTSLGLGAARPDRPLAAVVGDITLYHDMNGLLAVKRCGVPVTIVLLNNGGGGIFNHLPIRQFEPEFTDYFLTPHNLDFSHAARLYGLDHIVVKSRENFRDAFGERIGSRKSTIIEVQTDSRQDFARRKEVTEFVRRKLETR